mmetsp:Transcript_116782/g.341927  ORF Transcript_116782/g.341927 Transcript_116782/m.341927 type:complete len:238 (-) Transcript_116782:781-1494(-)
MARCELLQHLLAGRVYLQRRSGLRKAPEPLHRRLGARDHEPLRGRLRGPVLLPRVAQRRPPGGVADAPHCGVRPAVAQDGRGLLAAQVRGQPGEHPRDPPGQLVGRARGGWPHLRGLVRGGGGPVRRLRAAALPRHLAQAPGLLAGARREHHPPVHGSRLRGQRRAAGVQRQHGAGPQLQAQRLREAHRLRAEPQRRGRRVDLRERRERELGLQTRLERLQRDVCRCILSLRSRFEP